jgi:hypothetical protein
MYRLITLDRAVRFPAIQRCRQLRWPDAEFPVLMPLVIHIGFYGSQRVFGFVLSGPRFLLMRSKQGNTKSFVQALGNRRNLER